MLCDYRYPVLCTTCDKKILLNKVESNLMQLIIILNKSQIHVCINIYDVDGKRKSHS